MKIYKRRNIDGSLSKKYSYDFYIKGVRHRGSCYTTKRTEAIEYVEKLRKSIIDKIVFDIKNPSFNELLTFFIKNKKDYLENLSKSVKSQYKLTFRLADAFFYSKQFDKDNINKFILEIKHTRKVTDRTLLKYIDPLRTICKFALSQGELTSNPFDDIDLTDINKSRTAERIRFLSKEEYEKLNKVMINNPIKDYVEFAINTGLRKSEQLNLSWDRVDFKEQTIYIDKTKTDNPRTIPLMPPALKILEHRYNEKLNQPFPFTAGKLGYIWTKVMQQAELENFVWHDLRHTFASWAVMGWHKWQNSKITIFDVSKWLGHTDIKMTQKYAHSDVDNLKRYNKEQQKE